MGSNIGLSVSTLDPVAVSAMRTPNDHCQDRNVQAARRTAVSKTSGRHSSLPPVRRDRDTYGLAAARSGMTMLVGNARPRANRSRGLGSSSVRLRVPSMAML
jgi:hypothetical protein